MEQNTVKLFFALLRSAVCGVMLTQEELELYSSVQWQDLLKIATKHDMQHLLAYGLKLNNLITKENESLEQHIFTAAFRCESLQHELDSLCSALEKAQVPFIPLKGSVLRNYYPEAWMRTSCDIDILVHNEDIPKAVEYLTEYLKYTAKDRGSHEVSLYSPGGVHIELHFDLVEEGTANNVLDLSRLVWENVSLHKNNRYFCEMTDAFFYLHHIVHMVKHIETGGCGIRPFIDLWILDNMDNTDKSARDDLLNKASLLKFAEVSRDLSKMWFGDKEPDELLLQMQSFLLQGGAYGSSDNRVAIQQKRKGGRVGYILSRVFAPSAKLKRYYPVLERHPWLMPVMQVRRWFMLLNPNVARMAKREITANGSMTESRADELNRLFGNIGLK